MISSSKKRHGMLLYNSNGTLSTSASSLSISSHTATSSNTLQSTTQPNRRINRSTTTASLSLASFLQNDEETNPSTSSSNFTILQDSTNNARQKPASPEVRRYREEALGKLIRSKNLNDGKENINHNGAYLKDLSSEANNKRKTSVVANAQSSLKESASSARSSNRASTYSIGSIVTTKSNSSSFKSLAHKLANVVSSSSSSDKDAGSASPDESDKRRFRHSRHSSNLSGSSLLEQSNSSTAIIPDHPITNAQDPEVFDPLKDTEETHEQLAVPQLKKKSSLFRLKHSISLRSLTSSRGSNDTESLNSTTTSSDASLRRINLSSIRKSIVSFGGGGISSSNSAASNRMSVDYSAIDKSNISLPVLQQGSRGKITSKLKNSSSLLSISSFVSNATTTNHESVNDVYTIKTPELDQIQQKLLLRLCNQQKIVSFNTFMNKLRSKEKKIEKLAESSFSEVFLERKIQSNRPICVWKVIPFGDESRNQQQLNELIQELSITMAMSTVEGFIKIKSATVVRGGFPEELIDSWDCFQESKGNFENERPDIFGKHQLHLVMRLEYGGEDLKQFEIKNWRQAYSIFWKIAEILKKGEESHEFEHRDLHWGNVVIKESETKTTQESSEALSLDDDNESDNNVSVSIIDFTLSRAKIADKIVFTGLDIPGFFKGKGDYQYEIYRLMRQKLSSQPSQIPKSESTISLSSTLTTASTATNNYSGTFVDWSVKHHQLNVFWLHYILDRLINHKNLKPIRMNPITRSTSSHFINGVNSGGSIGMNNEISNEIASYDKLIYLSKLIDPSKKKRRFKREFESVGDFVDWCHKSRVY
ncbi:hypothetical protein CANARDRAFT_28786 [[Candida] arabinofermentans NRRL YB-2248]|uniref:non-specific serine/threonine protein kinase n=1 Tax=[Candida] arabinofermentans NRRL YB-2248 TaxID=983967 RepID=A0A1E4T032_9ASCO|nr:hypothetical protein CANARDRAFT_28786 [[Candida] arabinofermentans NRRL YB-2248]